jgi:hypothetical protein
MALEFTTLEAIAKVFKVHPRTIVRALAGKHNTYWTEDINHDRYSTAEVAKVYGMNHNALIRVLEGRDELYTPKEAAKELGIADRTFRDRLTRGQYKVIGYGGITRYLRSKIVEDAIARME